MGVNQLILGNAQFFVWQGTSFFEAGAGLFSPAPPQKNAVTPPNGITERFPSSSFVAHTNYSQTPYGSPWAGWHLL